MTQSIDLKSAGLVGLGRDAIASLRETLFQGLGPDAAGYLQQAGYAGGDAVHAAFERWLAAQGKPAPESLDVETFAADASRFFSALGWGSLALTPRAPVATLDSPDWVEANGAAGQEGPGCHVGTGLMAAFFGRVAAQPLAVMEVECRAAGAPRCRFLLGSAEEMQRVWERLAAGEPYEA